MSLHSAFSKRAIGLLAPRRVLYRGSGRVQQIALTFDDGPHPEHTPLILEALAAAKATATFFLQGSQAARYPDLVRAIHTQGHQLANHAASHRKPRELSTNAYVREVIDTQALLSDITAAALPRVFRPPYGETSLGSAAQLLRAGYRYVFWSRDSRDSWLKEPAALLSAFERQPPQAGDIVLFHDDYAQTASALPGLLRQLARLRLSPVSIEALR